MIYENHQENNLARINYPDPFIMFLFRIVSISESIPYNNIFPITIGNIRKNIFVKIFYFRLCMWGIRYILL